MIAILSACAADCGLAVLASVTFTVKFAVPLGPFGVPVIAPVELLKLSPVGNVPVPRE